MRCWRINKTTHLVSSCDVDGFAAIADFTTADFTIDLGTQPERKPAHQTSGSLKNADERNKSNICRKLAPRSKIAQVQAHSKSHIVHGSRAKQTRNFVRARLALLKEHRPNTSLQQLQEEPCGGWSRASCGGTCSILKIHAAAS